MHCVSNKQAIETINLEYQVVNKGWEQWQSNINSIYGSQILVRWGEIP